LFFVTFKFQNRLSYTGACMVDSIDEALRIWFKGAGRVVIAGIGNPIRSDDNVGLQIVGALQGKVRCGVLLLECETVPESYMLDIEEFQPTHVLLVDASILGLKPGEAKLLNADQIASFEAISSHVLPLRIFCEYMKNQTSAKVGLLLVEPQSLEFAEGLTPTLETAANHLSGVLAQLLS
jgi:hydrogenase 3 maturation protease